VAALTLAPFGLRWTRNLLPSAPNYAPNKYFIVKGYASAIGFGDLVETNTGGANFGSVKIYTAGDSHTLGVFMGCLPYFDTALQQYVNKQWYAGTETPGDVVECCVIDDPFAIFTMQVGGVSGNNPIGRLMRGGNIDVAQNGTPNTATGMSIAYADATTYNNTTATLPLRILGQSQMGFPGYNPANVNNFIAATAPTNDYIEVRLNTSEHLTATGI
jgi:hypothetical protein